MKYPRNEIWIRKVYEDLVKEEKLKVMFRPGERICDGKKEKCFHPGEEVLLRVLERPGDSERNIEPQFTGTVRKAKIKEMKEIKIEELTEKDFEGSSPDVQNIEQLKYHFGLVYNLSLVEIEKVTKIEIEYL